MLSGEGSGRVIWITGLSGSGKTSLARALLGELAGAVFLDGDALREVLGAAGGGFDPASRRNLALTYARLAGLLAGQGLTVVVATISLFHEVHAWNRENLPGYLEVFLDVPREVCRRRDPKGLYAARNAAEMVGSGMEAEFPLSPHLVLNERVSVAEGVQAILHTLAARGAACPE